MKRVFVVIALLLMMGLFVPMAFSEVLFTHAFDALQGDDTLDLCPDGEGGFYALSRQMLFRWQPSEAHMNAIGRNEYGISSLACRGEEVYGMSSQTGLFRFDHSAWIQLGLPPWNKPEAGRDTAGIIGFLPEVVMGKDRVFFFSVDAEQEMNYLSAYLLDSGEFAVEPQAVFSRSGFVYDAQKDEIIGGVPDEAFNHFLAHYDYQTHTLTQVQSAPYAGEITGYHAARAKALFSGYWGAMLGLSLDDALLIPGTPMRVSSVVLLDEEHVAYAVGQRDGESAKIVVLRYDPDKLDPLP